MGKKKREELRQEITSLVTSFCDDFISVLGTARLFMVEWVDLPHNDEGGVFSVVYEPSNFIVTVYIYDGILDLIPSDGITESFSTFVEYGVAHELGHTVIWGLEGTKKSIEQAATIIGTLLMKVRRGKGKEG